MPAGAVTKPTIDVDGDGRPDTEWISRDVAPDGSKPFGVATASGGVFSAGFHDSPSGASREALVADVTGHGELIALATDGREVDLWAISGCSLVPELNPQGQQYTFDYGRGGYGTGVGCTDVDGDGTPDLAGLLADGSAVQQTAIQLDGPHARNGMRRTIDPASPAQLAAAQQVTCGNVTLQADGVSETPQ